jgi:phage terminase large subunit-like protein
VTSNPDSDETGIVVAGKDGRFPAHFYVLEDATDIYTPDEWGRRACGLYETHLADRIIGEANNGGDLVEANLRHQNADVSYAKVTASRGKTIRAEPIAALYEQNRVHHVGSLAKLEDECCNWNPQLENQDSPNRMDALVWAMTELSGSNDAYLEYVKSEVRTMEAAGDLPVTVASRTLVDGSNMDRCECGSVVFVVNGAEETCYKCGKARAK